MATAWSSNRLCALTDSVRNDSMARGSQLASSALYGQTVYRHWSKQKRSGGRRRSGIRRPFCLRNSSEAEQDVLGKSSDDVSGSLREYGVVRESGEVSGRRTCKPCLLGLATAVKHFRNDADLLARQFSRLDMRARRDVALLGSRFLFLDARVREDAEFLDSRARHKVDRLRHVALVLEETLSNAAERHWNDGRLEADLRLADLRARRRALEDAYVSVQAVGMVLRAVVDVLRLRVDDEEALPPNVVRRRDLSGEEAQPWERLSSTGRLLAVEEAYQAMLNAASNVDGTEMLDSEELEFIVAALVDLEEVGGANGASLVAEAVKSPDAETRRALVEGLATAPSLWTLGNAGIGALQRLTGDSNLAVSEAASKALQELEAQWVQQSPSSTLLKFPKGLEITGGLPDPQDPKDDSKSWESDEDDKDKNT